MHRLAPVVATYAQAHLALANAKLSDSYYYQSLPLCVVDAVFSVGVRYGQVLKVVEGLCQRQGWARYRHHGRAYPLAKDQARVSALAALFPGPVSNQAIAMVILGNMGYVNPRASNPTLKAEVVRQFAKVLKESEVETFQDLERQDVKWKTMIGVKVKALPGMSSGVVVRYFEMLAGNDNQVKPDRMILRFIKDATGENVTADEAVEIVRDVCSLLKVEYPHLTPRMLDHEIWKFQR